MCYVCFICVLLFADLFISVVCCFVACFVVCFELACVCVVSVRFCCRVVLLGFVVVRLFRGFICALAFCCVRLCLLFCLFCVACV